MDAHALLTSQGWRGTGHSLDKNNAGLKRPLLVSRKDNVLGVGKKQHKTADMWWQNAYDGSLKGLDTSKQGEVVQTVTSGGLDMVKKGGSRFVGKLGLYSSFVRGECLSGTIDESILESSGINTSSSSGVSTPVGKELATRSEKKRRKRDRDASETKEERKARKAAKRAARAKLALVEEALKVEEPLEKDITQVETKEERRERKRLKKLAKEAKQKDIETPSEKEKKKKRRKD